MARLKITRIQCHTQEDWTFDDDIELRVDGECVWGGEMNDGEKADITIDPPKTRDFEGDVRLEMYELDCEGHDKLGSQPITPHDMQGVEVEIVYSLDGARYSVWYTVEAEPEGNVDTDVDEDQSDTPDDADTPEDADAYQPPGGDGCVGDPIVSCPLARLAVVVMTEEGQLIEGVAVTLTPGVYRAETGADGMVEFSELQPGTYSVQASKPHYLPEVVGREVAVAAGTVENVFLELDPQFEITELDLRDIDGMPLQYLSADDHSYFNGHTRIHGAITLAGVPEDQIEVVVLDVIQNGHVVAVANLARNPTAALRGRPFGNDGRLAVAGAHLLFELTAAQASNVDGTRDGTLTLRAKARSAAGREAMRDYATHVQILVRYRGANRYGHRDDRAPNNRGGDDWVLPSVVPVIEHYSAAVPGFILGDISNMNGGSFAPAHAGHHGGNEVDAWFTGYNARDAATAQVIIDMLNNARYGHRITTVYVTFTAAFRRAIRGVVLNDGRQASAVIINAARHATHCHLTITPA